MKAFGPIPRKTQRLPLVARQIAGKAGQIPLPQAHLAEQGANRQGDQPRQGKVHFAGAPFRQITPHQWVTSLMTPPCPRRDKGRPGILTLHLAMLSYRFEFAVPRGENFRLAPGNFSPRGHVTQGAMEPPWVVIFDISGYDLAGIFQRERAARSDVSPLSRVYLVLQGGGGLLAAALENESATLGKLVLPAVKLAGLDAVLVAWIADWLFVHPVAFEDGYHFFGR